MGHGYGIRIQTHPALPPSSPSPILNKTLHSPLILSVLSIAWKNRLPTGTSRDVSASTSDSVSVKRERKALRIVVFWVIWLLWSGGR
jgi:hypothetical protein